MQQHAKDQDAAFGLWVTRVSPSLLRLAVLLSGDWHQAEDLVQTAMIRSYASGSWHHADHPEAYARQIVINQYRSWLRKRSSRERPVDQFAESDVGVFDPDGPELRLMLFSALAGLSKLDRAVVVLRYWDDRSVAETAELLRCSPGAIRNRSARALSRLRTVITAGRTPTTPDRDSLLCRRKV